MLSIDITDRQIKLVRGSAQGSKIKIDEVDFREIEAGLVSNGYIADVPLVAAEIIDMINTRGIKEKDTIVSVSSSSILYKELMLPKPKKLSNTAAIEAMIGSNMGISNEYNISYTIVGETKDENQNPLIKVLATACPQRLVDGYVKLFTHIGLSLKAVNISNNSISRLIQNTPKMSNYMPLLLVQIDKEFLNINLYEDNVLSFSRYFKIDASDYNNAPDYVNQAVYDNLFRMFQFFQSRKDMKPIKEMMFYGEIPDFIALSNAVQSFNVPCHILSTPTTIASRADYEFTKFANAIGALYKVDKELEHINLLDTTAAKESKGLNTFFIGMGAAAILSVGALFGANAVINMINDGIKADIAKVNAQINDTEFQARLNELSRKEGVLANFESYKSSIANAEIMYNYMPKATTDVYKMLREPFTVNEEGVEQITDAKIKEALKGTKIAGSVSISGYSVNANFTCEREDQPSQFVRALIAQGYFENIAYTGYSVQTASSDDKNSSGEEKKKVSFSLTMLLKAGNDVTYTEDEVNSTLNSGNEEAAAQ
ncbi:MAG: pilus assembly protein PilM [Oscillospiraceae bacterium]|nr:pilus assembly protein PilM [Oscillospiraceae bacterium]